MPTTGEIRETQAGAVCVATLSWWQLEETAHCPFCWQGYAFELHIACIGCDRVACPLCVDREDASGPRCPECVNEPPDAESAEEGTR